MTEQQWFGLTEPGSVRAGIESALAARLRSVAPCLVAGELPGVDPDPAVDAAAVLDVLVSSVVAAPANDRIWLLLTAVGASFPTRGVVDSVRRALELSDRTGAVVAVLDAGLAGLGDPDAVVEVVRGGVLTDVDLTAKHDVHTGIQQVVRSLLPLWVGRGVVPVAWTGAAGAFRRLSRTESERVTSWATRQARIRADHGDGVSSNASDDPDDVQGSDRPDDSDDADDLDDSVSAPGSSGVAVKVPGASRRPPVLEVPWRSVVVMVEVPPVGVFDQVMALAQCSGNRLTGILYDVIPVTSADLVAPVVTSGFVRYLAAVKFASRMAGISAAAAEELAGFVQTLASQGIRGPVVGEVALPAGERRRVDAPPPVGAPSVVVVGSHEPRKNHLAVLHAAELLWREGFDFTLTFIGAGGWGEEFPRRVAELQGVGRPIRVRLAVSDEELSRAYASASFTVFPSLHEGFGLPVAESLSYGTPVITTGYGSTAEIGGAGGCVLVDPRDDAALTGAMRRLLGEPEVLRGLRAQVAQRPVRGWSDYADELWEFLVVPELVALREGGAGDGSFSD